MKFLYYLRRAAFIYLMAVAGLGIAYLLLPPVSTLMLARWVTLHSVERQTVPLHEISPSLLRAVIRAEDSKFCQHYGVDWESMGDAIEQKRKHMRGASTLSMQVAKNLFLWPQRSYVRKILEIPIAIYLDAIWPKSRMMEVYLSIAEWGDGIFGIEAAAQVYFHKHASQLTSGQAALLVGMLPNPLKRHPTNPSGAYLKHAQNILKGSGGADISCIRKAL